MIFSSPHSGQIQSSGKSLNLVPTLISAFSSPKSGLYSYPQPLHTCTLGVYPTLGTALFIFFIGGASFFLPVSKAAASRGKNSSTSPTIP